jgi:hypothetical protein
MCHNELAGRLITSASSCFSGAEELHKVPLRASTRLLVAHEVFESECITEQMLLRMLPLQLRSGMTNSKCNGMVSRSASEHASNLMDLAQVVSDFASFRVRRNLSMHQQMHKLPMMMSCTFLIHASMP